MINISNDKRRAFTVSWEREVPTPVQKAKALKLLKKMKVTNIKVRVVKP
jgi:hypothetical protein